jgi:hypothetical protein
MAALTQARMSRTKTLSTVSLPSAAQKFYQGGMACADITTGTVKNGAAANANLLRIGKFVETTDNSGGVGKVTVELEKEINATWYNNGASGTITTANIFADCYILDDNTVTITSTGNSKAGRIWDVSAQYGVLVEAYTL